MFTLDTPVKSTNTSALSDGANVNATVVYVNTALCYLIFLAIAKKPCTLVLEQPLGLAECNSK